MFETIRQRLRDVATLKALSEGAERHANAEGKKEPGAEHFVLAALELPDGTAARAFERVQADPRGYRAAIERQYADALRALGIEPAAGHGVGVGAGVGEGDGHGDSPLPEPPGTGLYRAQASAQALMQDLAARRKADAAMPLLGAHVLLSAVATSRNGVAARALRAMGVEPARLAEAARAEIAAARAQSEAARAAA